MPAERLSLANTCACFLVGIFAAKTLPRLVCLALEAIAGAVLIGLVLWR